VKFLYIFCFLIISCDLPGEADTDCNGINNGLAEIDDCGVCSGGDTGLIQNQDIDCLENCFGDAIVDECGICDGGNVSCLGCDGIPNSGLELDDCGVCDGNDDCDCPGYPEGTTQDCFGQCDGDAIIDDCEICNGSTFLGNNPGDDCDCNNNVVDICGECDGPGVIDCMCESYITSNTNFNCTSEGNIPYNIDEQLSCETLDTEFSLCYPENCEATFKFSDFEDKIIWIIYEADWWTSCYSGTPQLEEIIREYLDNPNIAIINVLSDLPNQSYDCSQWGVNGDERIPIIVNDYDYNGIVRDWFDFNEWSMPQYIFIDQNFQYHAITQSESSAEIILEEMLNDFLGE